MRLIPVLKNGINVGLVGLAEGDLVMIEMTHFLPLNSGQFEAVLAYSFFRFAEIRRVMDQFFFCGDGYHFTEESLCAPTKMCTINSSCIRRISIFNPDSFEGKIAYVIFDLVVRNDELLKENKELSERNVQLMFSHFNNFSHTVN